MKFLRPSSKILTAAMLAAAARLAVAQDAIIFSKPPEDPAAKANSFMDQSVRHDAAPLKTPAALFNGPQATANFDAAAFARRPQPPSPQQIEQWKKNQDANKNWGLMTPAEIFGVPTPEQILGVPVSEEEKNLSPEDRFLRRGQREKNFSATNSMRAAGGVWNENDNPFATANNRNQRGQTDAADRSRRNDIFQSPFSTAASQKEIENAHRENSLWQSAFATPPSQPKADPEQIAEMERFRSLLETEPAVSTPQATPTAMTMQSPAAQPVMPEYKPPTAYVPAANFEAQRRDQIGRPAGIAPLPGISAPVKKKDDSQPLVKPPPWLTDQPQPNAPPQWKNF